MFNGAVNIFAAILAMLRRLHICYFGPFRRCSSGCMFVIFGRRGHVQAAAFFNIVGHFGHVPAAAFLLFLAVLAILRRLQFYNLPQFWPVRGTAHL